MNVVEKEATILEGLGGDIVTHANGKAHAKNSRAVIAHRSPVVSAVDVRRFISNCSEKLQRFVAPLEEEARRAMRLRTKGHRVSPRSVSKVAELVLGVIRKLAHRETGVYALDPNVAMLLSSLYAGSVEASIVCGLARRAQEAVAQLAQLERAEAFPSVGHRGELALRDYDVTRELDELLMLLKWYVRRKMSLAGLDLHALVAANASHNSDGRAGFSEEEDSLFGFEVVHDQRVFGTKGCFVSGELRLIGHDGQPLWMRVSVLDNGRPISVRSEWSSWTDPGGTEAIEVISDDAPFCSLVPIRPNSQRLVIDEIRAFVPYGALNLPTGRADVELCVAILDNEGREILTASRLESICVPRRELVHATVPAPHSVGMWPHDVVSGDKISDLAVSAGYKMVAGWERHCISVQFDLSLFMHAGESVLLECRFLNEQGEVVELSSLGIPYVASDLNVAVESVSSYRYRRVLHPRGAWAHYRSLCIDIPVEFLLLARGSHALTCEVVIVSSDDRVLCGDMGLVTVHVSGDTARDVELSEVSGAAVVPAAAGSSIELESIDIDAAWVFGGEDSIRIQATFCPTNTARQIAELAAGRVGELFSPYRIEIAVEREDGYLLLQAFSDALGMGFKPVTRSVCVEGHSGFAEHSVVANFAKEEILGWSCAADGHRAQSKLRLFARVRALSLSGEVLVSEGKEFFVKPLAGGGRRVVEVGVARPQVVDVVAFTYAQTSRVSCRVLVNMPHGRILEEGVTLLGALVMANGDRRQVVKRRIGVQHSAAWVRQQMGLSQIPVECDYTLSAGEVLPEEVEFTLLSAFDEVLQSVRHNVRVAGVLAAVDEGIDSKREGEDGSLSTSADLFASVSAAEPHVNENRGLFSWFKR
jgi:hypothetical protein